MNANHYEILGVSKHATTEEIKKAYRKKALKCHPDKTVAFLAAARKLAEEEFKKINYAHEVLTNPDLRKKYDRNNSTSFNAAQPENTYTYEEGSGAFTSYDDKGRVKLTGSSKTEIIFDNNNQTVKITFKLEKNSLEPMLERLNELVEALNNKAYSLDNCNKLVLTNKKYEVITRKMTAMYYDIMSHVDKLHGDIIDYSDMLLALNASQEIIMKALKDGECANHRGFVRNCPVLRELCVCLDVLANFFAFLSKKIAKTVSGDKTPVFTNGQELMCGMFKPIPTSTARKLDELSTEMTWYINEINEEYTSASLRQF